MTADSVLLRDDIVHIIFDLTSDQEKVFVAALRAMPNTQKNQDAKRNYNVLSRLAEIVDKEMNKRKTTSEIKQTKFAVCASISEAMQIHDSLEAHCKKLRHSEPESLSNFHDNKQTEITLRHAMIFINNAIFAWMRTNASMACLLKKTSRAPSTSPARSTSTIP